MSQTRTQESIVELPVTLIERGFFQPREYFSPEAMEATKRSIQEKGQLYPVIVRPIVLGNPLFDATWPESHYELADGERRFRCCKDLNFLTIKAVVRGLSDEEMLDHTLTTNDSLALNPIEKATVFSRLAKEFGKSQADIAKSFNLKQQQVSEYMRLLDLPKEIQDLTARAVISVRHARELLKIQDQEKMKEVALEIKHSSISTRELSKKIKNDKNHDSKHEKKQENALVITNNLINNHENSIKTSNLYQNHAIKTFFGRSSWLESLQRPLIPSKMYQKLEYWLSFTLGSKLKPEAWLLRIELSLLAGVFFAVSALWLPLQALVTISGIMVTLLFYLYVSR